MFPPLRGADAYGEKQKKNLTFLEIYDIIYIEKMKERKINEI